MDVNELMKEYELDFSLFSETDERLRAFNKLSDPQKIILVLYAELKSYRKVGKILGFSHQWVAKYLTGIKKVFYEGIDRN